MSDWQQLKTELELCQLYLAQAHRERILERRRRAALIDASTQTDGDARIGEPPTPTPESASDCTELPSLLSLDQQPLHKQPERLPLEIIVKKIQAKLRAQPPQRQMAILSPIKRKLTAPPRPAAPVKKPRILRIQLVKPPTAAKVAAPPTEPVDLTVD